MSLTGRKKRGKKRVLIYLFLVAAAAFMVSRIDVQSEKDYYESEEQVAEEPIHVTLQIICGTILDNYEKLDPSLQSKEYVPEDGIILAETTYEMNSGDTVFDLLKKAVRENKIQMEYQGADENAYGSVYIQGIGHLYEFSCGPLSGWMYRVNREIPDYGCSKYQLKDKDRVEFIYTCDLGKDIGRK